jgi:hypothetical protein
MTSKHLPLNLYKIPYYFDDADPLPIKFEKNWPAEDKVPDVYRSFLLELSVIEPVACCKIPFTPNISNSEYYE